MIFVLTHCLLILCGLLQLLDGANSLKLTPIPPLIDVPTFSLSTRGKDPSHDTMNILTYASPVSVKPDRMWSISLFKGTLSHENFSRERMGILQLLTPGHAEDTGRLIRVLGGSSGKDVNKRSECEKLGYAWNKLDTPECDTMQWPRVLPGCLYYLHLELQGDLIDCGSHEVAVCRVVSMTTKEAIGSETETALELDYLSTRELRQRGIISELGRIADS
eukprot:scaffold120053_cov73-Cyclotella_meneghiniana.AAC.4